MGDKWAIAIAVAEIGTSLGMAFATAVSSSANFPCNKNVHPP
jgi:hypothetical protein